MQDSSKYLIHADVTADGVVERTDVVGAVFGQTEGLLGEELDLRQLQESSKIGRIDVEIDSRNGQSYGELTIATNLDKVETATLAAALETITRIGPCRASVEVRSLEDLRAAKRRRIVDRAQELLIDAFDESMMTSEELVEEVRRRVRVEDITEYEGLPAGPRVEDSDALVIVEGRADVLTVLEAGIKNAIAVEGTDVPDTVARLTQERTTTAFLDGDRGGDLILRELAQVGDVDYAAFAPVGRSVEDLSRHEVLAALRGKVEYGIVADDETPHETVGTGGTVPSVEADQADDPTPESRFDDPAELLDPREPPDDDSIPPESPADGDTAAGRSAGPPASDSTAPTGRTASESTDGGVEPEPISGTSPSSGESGGSDPVGGSDDPRATDSDTEDSTGSASTEQAPSESADPSGTDSTATAPDAGVTATDAGSGEPSIVDDNQAADDDTADGAVSDDGPTSLQEHAADIVGSGEVRLLGDTMADFETAAADEAFDRLVEAEDVPSIVVLDGAADQRLLDIAAQRGVQRIVASSLGSFTKRPTSVRLTEAAALADGSP